jgi:EmrB/QacA subfamily drug resistance transporter
VVLASAMGNFALTLESGITGVSYPALAEAFHTDTSTVLWVSVAFWVTGVGLVMTLGWLGDVAGRRRAYTLGFVLLTIGLLMSSLAANIWQLIAFRVFMGIGSALILANVIAILMPVFPEGQRGRAMGVQGAVVGLGLSLGPLVGGVLLDTLDWRALFYMRIPVSVLGAAIAWWGLPHDVPQGKRPRVDVLGAASLFAVLASGLLLVNRGAENGWTSAIALAMAAVLAVSLPVLVWTQRRSVRPILDFALFRRVRYSFGLAVLMAHYLSMGAILVIAPFFFEDARGFSATKMGLFLTAFPLMRAFFSPLSGSLSDRVSTWLLSGAGLVMMGASLLWLSFLGLGASEWHILGSLILAGMGSAFYEPPNTHSIMASVPPDRHGTASASIASGRQLSFSIGVTLAGAVFAVRERVYLSGLVADGMAQESAAREAVARGFSDTLLAGAAIAAVGILVAMYAARKDRHAAGSTGGVPVALTK